MTELDKLKAQRNEINRKITQLEKEQTEEFIGGLRFENWGRLSINNHYYRAFYHNMHPEYLSDKRYQKCYEIIEARSMDEFISLVDELIEDLEKVREEITNDTN